MSYKVKKLLTRPTISLKKLDAECYVKIESSMHEGQEMKADKGSKEPKKPAIVCDVINLETGEAAQIVVGAVIKSTLDAEYPDEGYVGLCFHIKNTGKKDIPGGGSYNKFLIEEIEEPAQDKKIANIKK